MKNSINLTLIAACTTLLISIACTRDQNDPTTSKAETFESIEKGVSLEDARASLSGEYSEYKAGSKPDIDIIMYEDGRQLVFIDNVLTDKNTASKVDSVLKMRPTEELEK